jgi:hypothetical protein
MNQTDDGGYILVGFGNSADQSEKPYCWLVKTDADGNKEWDSKIENDQGCRGFGVRQTPDGGYIITGDSATFSFKIGQLFFYLGGKMWLVKTDANGNKTWEQTFGGVILESGSRCIELTDDDGYIIGGFTRGFGSSIKQTVALPIYSKTWVVKTDADGNNVGDMKYSRGICWWIEHTTDGGYIFTGATQAHGKGDIFLVKID